MNPSTPSSDGCWTPYLFLLRVGPVAMAADESERSEPGWAPIPVGTADEEDLADRLSRGFEPVTSRDWVMLSIAVIDILLLVARDVYSGFLPALADTTIVWIDLGILAVFALEFAWEISKASRKIAYVRNHWYEVVGMIPIAHWGVRSFRLVRVLRIYVVKSFPRERKPERDWSYALVRGLIVHYRNVLVEEITDPIVLTSINVIKGPMVRARWAETVGDSLEERREHIHTVVDDTMENTDGMGHLMRTRAGRRLVSRVTDAALDSVIHTLQSEELNEVIGESVGEILDELHEKVQEKDYARTGGSRFRPTFDT